ncbi:MAG: transaldolase [Anaerolineales bacterium]
MNRFEQLHKVGQSIWLDYIRRDLLSSGELAGLIQGGEVRGVTSNPTIFESAIAGTELYTGTIEELVSKGLGAEEILDDLILTDIRRACDQFASLYEESKYLDGYVSVEVNPSLANDTTGTLAEAKRLWSEVNRNNVMIKIPATKAGIPAIRSAIAAGISVNVTLIFSLERYAEVMESYMRGLEDRVQQEKDINQAASVASFFVSRVDSAVDRSLEILQSENLLESNKASRLMGKAAIANGKLAYAAFISHFRTPRFEKLQIEGAQLQRPLWASTSTKNPNYPDTYYVDNLIGPDTVNTLPPQTLEAFRDHGVVRNTIEEGLEEAEESLKNLEELGISMREVTDQLEREGVEKFASSYMNLVDTVRAKVDSLQAIG